MKNIFVLPTDKPSRLGYLTKKGKDVYKDLRLFDKPMPNILDSENQHIYIISDEEIKEWYIYEGRLLRASVNHSKYELLYGKPIILTTDPDLIKDGVQAIDDEFLEWFIKNPSCEFVKVENISLDNVIEEWWQDLSNEELIEVYKKTGNFRLGGWGHDIGPTQEDVEDMYLDIHNLKQLKDNYYKIIIPQEEQRQHIISIMKEDEELGLYEESKQETLEEANWKVLSTKDDTFYNGAKWQAERMYSEEEVLEILNKRVFDLKHKKDTKTTKEWFEQFKKK
jgi:hypothetical protein